MYLLHMCSACVGGGAHPKCSCRYPWKMLGGLLNHPWRCLSQSCSLSLELAMSTGLVASKSKPPSISMLVLQAYTGLCLPVYVCAGNWTQLLCTCGPSALTLKPATKQNLNRKILSRSEERKVPDDCENWPRKQRSALYSRCLAQGHN